MKRFARVLLSIGLVLAGIFSAAFGLKGFLLSSRFIDGGVTGISMLISDVLHLPLSILILVINLPFVAVGYRQIGRPLRSRVRWQSQASRSVWLL